MPRRKDNWTYIDKGTPITLSRWGGMTTLNVGKITAGALTVDKPYKALNATMTVTIDGKVYSGSIAKWTFQPSELDDYPIITATMAVTGRRESMQIDSVERLIRALSEEQKSKLRCLLAENTMTEKRERELDLD